MYRLGSYRTQAPSAIVLVCTVVLFLLLFSMSPSPMEENYLPIQRNYNVSVQDIARLLSDSTTQAKPVKMELKTQRDHDAEINATKEKTKFNIESYQFVNFTDSVKNLTSPVFLIIINYGFLDILSNLLISIQRIPLQPKILILCEDKTVYLELLKTHLNISLKYQLALTHLQEFSTKAVKYETKDYIRLMKKRVHYIELLVQNNLDVLHVDADMVLLADPLKYISDKNYDLFYQRDRDIACAGFFYLRANQKTKEFVAKWKDGIPKDDFGNQQAFNRAMNKCRGLKKKALPKDLFMSGNEVKESKSKGPWYSRSPKPVQIHANFMIGKDTKINWLKEHELWFAGE